jgi:hypothetical protein
MLQDKREILGEKNYPSASLSTTNPTETVLVCSCKGCILKLRELLSKSVGP